MSSGPRAKLRHVISHLWIRGYLKHRKARATRKVVLKILQSRGPCMVRGPAAIVPESEISKSDYSESYASENSRLSNSEWSASF